MQWKRSGACGSVPYPTHDAAKGSVVHELSVRLIPCPTHDAAKGSVVHELSVRLIPCPTHDAAKGSVEYTNELHA